jgi:hypothetical protein
MNKFIRIIPNRNNFGSGFFSNYRMILEDLIYNHENGMNRTPYIDWGQTAWVEGYNPFEGQPITRKENPFDFWFEQTIPNSDDDVINYIPIVSQTIIKHTLDYFGDNEQLNRQRLVEEKYIKLKGEINEKIDMIYNQNFKNEVVLGVVARGCEFFHWHPQNNTPTIEDYIKDINKILQENPQITKIFLVSEDYNYINILNKEFTNSYYMRDVFRRTDESIEYMNRVYLWPNMSTKRREQNKLLGEEVIIQTKLLGKCDYLYGAHTGVFCGAVLWGQNIKKIFKK